MKHKPDNAFQMLGRSTPVASELSRFFRRSETNRRNTNSGLSPFAVRPIHYFTKAVPAEKGKSK